MNYLICIANTFNLTSAKRDAINIVNVMSKTIHTENMFVVLAGSNKIEINLDIPKDNIFIVNDKDNFINVINTIKTIINDRNNANNILITLSSHGYNFYGDASHTESDGYTEYIMVGGDKIIDDELSAMLLTDYVKKINIYAIIDTCHSGTMLDLPFNLIDNVRVIENNNKFDQQIYCISACTDNQTSAEDISNLGFGGGLVSAFIDEIFDKDINIFDVPTFMKLHLNITNRLSHFNQKPLLSCSI